MLPLLLVALSVGPGGTAPPLRSLELVQTPAGFGTIPPNRPRVVEFWATWCGQCVEQIPRWNELAGRFRARIDFVAITAEDPETVTAFLKKRPMAGWVGLDLDGTAHESYEVDSVPRTFLVDARGSVRAVTTLAALQNADLEALAAGGAVLAGAPSAQQPGAG